MALITLDWVVIGAYFTLTMLVGLFMGRFAKGSKDFYRRIFRKVAGERETLLVVRHDYFRRILCKWVAEKVATGAFPDDEALLRPLLENICYKNAKTMIGGKP